MCQNVCLYHPLLSTVGIEVSSSILLCRCRSRYAVETFPVFCCFLAQFVSSCLRLRSCLPYSTYQVCFYLQFRTVHIRFVLCGFPDIKTYQFLQSEDLLQPSVITKYSWMWDIVFSSYQVCRNRTRYVVASFFPARPRSPSLASTLLPSCYYFTQYHTFQRCFPPHRLIGWFRRFSPFLFLVVFFCFIHFTRGLRENVGMGCCCSSCTVWCGRLCVPNSALA